LKCGTPPDSTPCNDVLSESLLPCICNPGEGGGTGTPQTAEQEATLANWITQILQTVWGINPFALLTETRGISARTYCAQLSPDTFERSVDRQAEAHSIRQPLVASFGQLSIDIVSLLPYLLAVLLILRARGRAPACVGFP
jgi:hypothetical protein